MIKRYREQNPHWLFFHYDFLNKCFFHLQIVFGLYTDVRFTDIFWMFLKLVVGQWSLTNCKYLTISFVFCERNKQRHTSASECITVRQIEKNFDKYSFVIMTLSAIAYFWIVDETLFCWLNLHVCKEKMRSLLMLFEINSRCCSHSICFSVIAKRVSKNRDAEDRHQLIFIAGCPRWEPLEKLKIKF